MTPRQAATAAAGPLLLLVLFASCCTADLHRPSYASVVAGTHKKPASAQAAPTAAPAPPAAPLAKPEEVAQATSQFSLDIAKDVIRHTEGNAVVSPVGVALLLSLLQQAADPLSDAAAQLERGLRLDRESSKRGIPRLLQNAVTKTKAKSVLENANNMFINSEFRIKEAFLDTALTHYNMNVSTVDFKQLDASVAAINKWASDATHGRISGLISKSSVTPRTSLVLASAMYFRGVWQRMFDAGKTVTKLFSTSPSRNATVFMMQQVGEFRLGDLPDLDAQWLELPFDGDHFSMLLVLPAKRHGANEVLQGLQPQHIASMLNKSSPKRAVVIMPRFHLSTEAGLTRTLKQQGMQALFSRDAKLRGITDSALSISEVLHKAEMKVDEQGAVASAASAVLVNTLSLISFSEEMKFFADHPFLAVIVDRTTQLPLFIGRVTNPEEGF